jgi:UDP-N-acetylglucosamine 2-epimerase
MVLTDSGGLQEESTVLGIPCLTLRDNTERPITIEQGTNVLVRPKRTTLADLNRIFGSSTVRLTDQELQHAPTIVRFAACCAIKPFADFAF